MSVVTDVLLALAVLAVWLACLGFARVPGTLDRLHCTTFAAVAAGPALLLAAFASQGGSPSVVKVLFLPGCFVVSGAAVTHAVARALTWRDREGAEP